MRGIEQLNDILDLIRNPDKYEAKAKALKDLVDQYKSLVEAHVKVSQVDAFVLETKRKNQEADANVEASKEQAAKIVVEARAQAEKILAEATVAKDKAEAFLSNTKVLEKECRTKMETLTIREQAVAKAEADVAKTQKEVEALFSELKDKKAKLLQAIG